jgi:hypothetical protein
LALVVRNVTFHLVHLCSQLAVGFGAVGKLYLQQTYLLLHLFDLSAVLFFYVFEFVDVLGPDALFLARLAL